MRLIVKSDPLAVRNALAVLLADSTIQSMSSGARGVAEIVLAEVLNNIVEHGYVEDPGVITIALKAHPGGVLVTLCDKGRPFPKDQLPEGKLPEVGSLAKLPEGGFGWFLIRQLVRHLKYRRESGCNHLSFNLAYSERGGAGSDT